MSGASSPNGGAPATGICYCDYTNGYAPTFADNTAYDASTYSGSCSAICTSSTGNECWDSSGGSPATMPSNCYIDVSASNACRCDELLGWYGDGSGGCVQLCVNSGSPADTDNCWDTVDTTYPYLSTNYPNCLVTAGVAPALPTCACDSAGGYTYTFANSDDF